MAWARSIKTGSVGRKAVLYVLANHAIKDGVVHDCPQKAIAEEAELSERQVRTILADLERIGVIERERRPGQGRGRQHDIIRLRMAELPLILGANRNRQPEKSSAGAATGNARRLPEKETASGCRSPKDLRAKAPEVISGDEGQPATGNRKSPPVAMEVVSSEGSNNTKQNTPLSPPKPERSSSRGERGSRLAEDWALPRSWGVEVAKDFSYSDHEVRFIAFEFANYWHSATGRNATKRDWRKTWLNWVARQNRRAVTENAKHWLPSADLQRADDGLGMLRTACTFRERHGEWPSNIDASKIPASVRAEFPKLFTDERAVA